MPKSNSELENNSTLYRAMRLPPLLAVDYFRSLGIKLSDDMVDTSLANARAKAFTIASVTSIDVLKAVHSEIDDALMQGLTKQQFIKNLGPRLSAFGYSTEKGGDLPPYRLKQIYRANMQQSYSAGRYLSQVANSDAQPYLQRVEIMDQRTRATHQAVHNVIYRLDDPWWQSNYPPYLNGQFEHGCRGRARPLSAEGLKDVQDRNPDLKVQESTADPDSFNVVGSAQFGVDVQAVRRLIDMPAGELRSAAIREMNNDPAREIAYKLWLKNALPRSVASVAFTAPQVFERTQEALIAVPEKLKSHDITPELKQLISATREIYRKGGITAYIVTYDNKKYMVMTEKGIIQSIKEGLDLDGWNKL